MITVSKGLRPPVLALRWVKDLGTRPNMSLKVVRKHHDMRMLGRIAGVRSTEQSVLSYCCGFDTHIMYMQSMRLGKKLSGKNTGTCENINLTYLKVNDIMTIKKVLPIDG